MKKKLIKLTSKQLMEKNPQFKEILYKSNKFFKLFAKSAHLTYDAWDIGDVMIYVLRKGRPFTASEKDSLRTVYALIQEHRNEEVR